MPTKTKLPKPHPTFRKRKSAVDAGQAWLAAKEAFDSAEVALKRARANLLSNLSVEYLDNDGQPNDEIAIIAWQGSEMVATKNATLAVGDRTILVQKQGRRDVDVDALDEAVSDFVFAQVTQTVVNLEAFDAAITMGLIDDDVVDEIVTTKDILAIREVKG
jgi:hypothetical protein